MWADTQGQQAWASAHSEGRVAVIRLPFPPTVNHAYAPTVKRNKAGRSFASIRKTEHAKTYAEEVWWNVRMQKARRLFAGPVAMLICAVPPNALRRDVANLEKVLTDALVAAEVMLDDSQVRDVRIVWAHSIYSQQLLPPGVEVSVRELSLGELSVLPPQPKRPRKTVRETT